MSRLAIIFAIIPITVMLTLSYFVLVSAEKSVSDGLKKFAKVIAILLWVSSGVLLTGAVVRTVCGGRLCPPVMCSPMMMHHGMGAMKGGEACPMVGGPGAMMGYGMGMHHKCCAAGTNAAKP